MIPNTADTVDRMRGEPRAEQIKILQAAFDGLTAHRLLAHERHQAFMKFQKQSKPPRAFVPPDGLNTDQKAILRRAFHYGYISPHLASHMLNIERKAAQRRLATLEKRGFLYRSSWGTYRITDAEN